MAQISEVGGDPTQLLGALRQGLESLDLRELQPFQVYTRTVLPVDGYVFWTPTTTESVRGSLHYAQQIEQGVDETVGFATIILTSEDKVMALSEMNENKIYVATQGNFRYAFSRQDGFYTHAGLWHYFGHSIYPAMESQLLDPGNTIDFSRAVVSNSLPFWIDINSYSPTYLGLTNPVTLYPSYLVAENLEPPYGVVDIQTTNAIQSTPLRGIYGSHTQLVRDHVEITLYGLQNNEALDFQDLVNQYTLDTGNFGLMNTPALFDEHRTQVELQALAMKKTLKLDIDYYQSRSAAVAFQLIKSAVPTLILGERFA